MSPKSHKPVTYGLYLLLTVCLGLMLSPVAKAQCTYTLSITNWMAPAEGGSITVDVITDPGCAWSVRLLPEHTIGWPWLSASISSHVGSGSVTLCAPRASSSCCAITNNITIAGQIFQTVQIAPKPPYTLPTNSWTVNGNGDGMLLDFPYTGCCTFSVLNSSDWVAVSTNDAQYLGRWLSFGVARNTNALPRSTTITIAGQDLTINQPVQSPEPGQIAFSHAPFSTINRHNLGLSWAEIEPGAPRAEWYHLLITDWYMNTNVDLWLQSTNWHATNSFDSAQYTCRVQGWNSAGFGPWSDNIYLNAWANPPAAPSLLAPMSNETITTPIVTYSWVPDSFPSWYELYVIKDSKVFMDKWFSVSEVEPNFQLTLGDHSSGQYSWWLRGWNSEGMGDWSSTSSFAVSLRKPAAVSLVGPNNIVYPMTLTNFCWSEDTSASWYCLWVSRNNSKYLSQWVHATNSWTPTNAFPAGNYTWWVQAWNSEGLGPWSTAASFTVPSGATPLSPVGTVPATGFNPGSQPCYSWFRDESSTWYELYINKQGALYFHEWIPLADLHENIPGVCTCCKPYDKSYQLQGSYTWWVRGWSPETGMGPWSPATSFDVAP